jgi:hypothetical protein
VLAFFSGAFFEERAVAAICACGAPRAGQPRVPRCRFRARGPRGPPSSRSPGWRRGPEIATSWSSSPAGADQEARLALLPARARRRRALAWERSPRGAWSSGAGGRALVVIGYALSGRLLPGVVPPARHRARAARLEQPMTYWNATGALAAIGSSSAPASPAT